eukprot:TRINITY_DN16149_c0_g1::TRINITY_DN16149_c0_g1_i1::g.6359::m.6359 TRINITY_DN16149_c0_g1::TRINITY_DN16149_c0_g1_i1::g.6359  ORF type:complete len:326 (-),score=12.77,sp/Q8YRI1/YY46_NOSS1/25.00/4e-20,sp/Q8YRI1/YY46_NOSS1/25.26/1e-18,sp/Q8YRI1/YY46_NOSS1/23.66/2e-16,sp/Q8YRI1/YY46_NOSS1/23.40/7e-15,sp/Q8YRI1/YY46_NOSS1/23.90/2e-14,sp/Q8YRI1/YY46_NOSS1/23.15/3e-08,WD40/PF00400.27/8.2,WD40/PF00400.27/9.8e-08,WD40/PF00400.27/9.1e-07,WD40/PF00400.27/3.6e+02,WD40/PF00400.27/9e-06,WD40/PF00400.27/7e+03,Nup
MTPITTAADCIFRAHDDVVLTNAFSLTGSSYYSFGGDEKLKVWDLKHLKKSEEPDGMANLAPSRVIDNLHPAGGDATSFSVNTDLLAFTTTVKHDMVLQSTSDAQTRQTLPSCHNEWINHCAFHPSGKEFFTCGRDSLCKMWDVASSKLLHNFQHEKSVHRCSFTSGGSLLVTCSEDRHVRVWDLSSMKLIRALQDEGQAVGQALRDRLLTYGTHAKFSTDGSQLAIATAHGVILVYDTKTWSVMQTISGHQGWIHDIEFCPGKPILCSVGGDNFAKFWNTSTAELLERLDVSEPRQCLFSHASYSTPRIAITSASGLVHFRTYS